MSYERRKYPSAQRCKQANSSLVAIVCLLKFLTLVNKDGTVKLSLQRICVGLAPNLLTVIKNMMIHLLRGLVIPVLLEPVF